MACAGKCHLQKRIAETNDTNDENLPSRVNLEDYPLSVLTVEGWYLSQVLEPLCVLNGAYQNGYEFLMSNAPFHPPQV